MGIDAGTYRLTWGQSVPPLKKNSTVLRAYDDRKIAVLGTITVQVQKARVSTSKTLKLHVVEGEGFSLLGTDWLTRTQVGGLGRLFSIEVHESLEQILIENREVFKDELGKLILKSHCTSINKKHPIFSRIIKYLAH